MREPQGAKPRESVRGVCVPGFEPSRDWDACA